MKKNIYDVIVIGGGASGLFCGMLCAQGGKKILILESQPECGRKLSASGGGYANFSNSNLSANHYLCTGDNTCLQIALKEFGVAEITSMIKTWKLPFEKREHGKLFLISPAHLLTRTLYQNCVHSGAKIITNCVARQVRRHSQGWEIACQTGLFRCRNLVIAPGSNAHPRLSGPPDCWRILSALGLPVKPARAALVPLLFGAEKDLQLFAPLAGISLEAILQTEGHSWRESLLFTHHGLSGPAILNASLYYLNQLGINFLPETQFESLLDEFPSRTPRSSLRRHVPGRLADALLPPELAEKKNGQLSRATRTLLGKIVNSFQISNLKRASIAKAEICLGGVPTSAVKQNSLESVNLPGVFIIGEAIDIAGELGGYNLHWAWASAWLAAKAILKK